MKSFTNMDELKKTIPDDVFNQLKGLLKNSKLEENEHNLYKIIESWLLKQALFNKITEHNDFKKTERFKKEDYSGCIAITLSGSILSIGPKIENKRKVIYTSIDIRKDVPKIVEEENAVLSTDIVIGEPANFSAGRIITTSEIYSVCLPNEDQIEEATVNKIIEINKLLLENFLQVDNFTFKANYYDNMLANKNDLFKQWLIIDWFIIGGFEKHIFKARAKLLWLELFSKLYQEILKNKKLENDLEDLFIEFTNVRFAWFIDDYKWYESEKKNFDIGLMKALEQLPLLKNYWDYLDKYLNEISK
ncbi:MAG: hypothetical protein JXB50_13330 [Spirochaetes bacterium]|nr:hypothetical protein [Spirochaetota bacterium]